MPDQWKDRQKPNLDHLMNLFDNVELGAFIAGHLVLESVIVQLIELKLTEADKFSLFDMSFPSKIQLAQSRGLLNSGHAEFLIEVNRIRNRIAHRLGEAITFESMFSLAKLAHNSGIDFSDDTIHTDSVLSKEWYGTQGVIQEIFQNAAQDFSFLMEENGGEFQFC